MTLQLSPARAHNVRKEAFDVVLELLRPPCSGKAEYKGNITDMIGGDNDAWTLLQVNPNNLQDLSPLNRRMLQNYITILQQTRDIGKREMMLFIGT